MASSAHYVQPLSYPVNNYGNRYQPITTHGLRGSDSDSSEVGQFNFVNIDTDSFKFSICKSMMRSCVETIKEDRRCLTHGTCSGFRNNITIPITHSICGYSANNCDDTELELTLKKLYDVGAINDDKTRAKKIDDDIKALTDMKNNAMIVKSSLDFEDAKKAKEERDFISAGISGESGSGSTDLNLEKETEQDEAVV